MELKKHWENLDSSDFPRKRRTLRIRGEKFESLLSGSLLSRADALCIFPNVFQDFPFPWIALKLHFKPFDKVPGVMLRPGLADQELVRLFYNEMKLRPCLSSFKTMFPKNKVPEYFLVDCPLCENDVPAIRYVFYGGLLAPSFDESLNFNFMRRVLVSFKSGDLAELINAGGLLSEDNKEALFTVIALKPVLEKFLNQKEDILKIYEFRDNFYILTLKFEKMEESLLWSIFSPFFRNIVDSWFDWEPVFVSFPSTLLPYLENKDSFSKLVNFYKTVSDVYLSLIKK